jgi:Tol biopolymer transport system component
MTRWYTITTFMAALGLGILMFIASAVGYLFDGDELAFTHCDETREHCSLSFLDLERGIIAAHPLEGTPFDLAWSPDGSRMVISQLTMDGVWTYLLDRDGSIRRFQPLIFATTWLSEDRLMIQTSLTEFQVYDFVTAAFEPTIYTISESYSNVFFAQLSPDGHYYVVNPMTAQELNILPVTSTDTDSDTMRFYNMVIEQNFDWSPDNREIVYSLQNVYNSDIYAMTLATGEIRQLTSSADNEIFARWSQGGNRIAFVSTNSFYQYQLNISDESDSIHTINLTSRLQAQILVFSALEWSFDDRYLVVQLYFVGSIGDFYLISTDGTDIIRRLTYNGNNNIPAWRP